ncbi:ABC transporter ATP-binding protein [Haloferax sulfurifontis]|uniref:Molybdate/tungstate import ATP-binding protein WtpC n=1 Tax=Haloferax sulfurifontis TaxID=255616 RepID=A0A830E4V5_9EURY|nr:ABC transporter ATP-binding protein [Haloferax sulfurifontis]GGC50734.1 polyamine-transporting ATPase [Haloferax sulfurifontis]
MATQQFDSTVTDSSETVVRIDGVTKEYGTLRAVDDVTIPITDGEFITILGPSGAGKTTLLHMIAGFQKPTSGEIYIDGRPVSDEPPYERDIGLVFQSHALFPHMTVKENIAFPLKMRREHTDDIDRKVEDVLELVRLPVDYADKPVDELSGGQQQRVAFARAIVYEPTLLLLDEPLSSLDKKLREEMRAELTRIHEETELTIVHVTHNQTEALSMADRIAVINGGGLEQLDSAQDIYASPNTPFVADFIGNTTLLSGSVAGVDGDVATVSVADGTVRVPAATVDGLSDVVVAIRAEQVALDADCDNTYPATVEQVSFEGERTQYHVFVPAFGETVRLIDQSADARVVHDRGDSVTVGWNVGDGFVYPDEDDE